MWVPDERRLHDHVDGVQMTTMGRPDDYNLSGQVTTIRAARWPLILSWNTMGPVAEARDLVSRHAERLVFEALSDTRVVLVNGARQAGKSTLTRLVAGRAGEATLRLLDDPSTLRAATDDPTEFVDHDGLMVIDEIQLVPELLCVFHSSDTELLARIVRHPALQGFGARLLAPGVLIATGPRENVLAALRAAGYPAAEDPAPGPPPPLAAGEPPPDFDTLAARLRTDPHVPPRSPARRSPAPTRSSALRSPRPSRPRSALERAERVITREARELNSDEIRLLARAVAENWQVRITYVDQEGVETDRVIGPPYEQVQMGKKKLLKAICEMRSAQTGRQEERNFHYARIQSVQAVDRSPGPWRTVSE